LKHRGTETTGNPAEKFLSLAQIALMNYEELDGSVRLSSEKNSVRLRAPCDSVVN
jgi:hypothetical protein